MYVSTVKSRRSKWHDIRWFDGSKEKEKKKIKEQKPSEG